MYWKNFEYQTIMKINICRPRSHFPIRKITKNSPTAIKKYIIWSDKRNLIRTTHSISDSPHPFSHFVVYCAPSLSIKLDVSNIMRYIIIRIRPIYFFHPTNGPGNISYFIHRSIHPKPIYNILAQTQIVK